MATGQVFPGTGLGPSAGPGPGFGPGLGSGSGQRLKAGFGASSRHFKRAVDRNRIKRLTREAYRLQKQDLQEFLKIKGLALAIFIIYTGKEVPDYQTVREKIGVALQKLVKELGT